MGPTKDAVGGLDAGRRATIGSTFRRAGCCRQNSPGWKSGEEAQAKGFFPPSGEAHVYRGG